MTASNRPRLTRDQDALLAEWKPWQARQTKRLTRRFGNWVSAETIAMLVEDASLEGVARFDDTRGVPLGAFLLKCVVRAVWGAVRHGAARAP